MAKVPLFALAFLLLSTKPAVPQDAGFPRTSENRIPVLVELFTSEGCSSCPPADRLLQKLDNQPVPGTEVVALSEHVDYWDHLGWRDPHSARLFSQRQEEYARSFGLAGGYTPQMVVDGAREFVGSDSAAASKALAKAIGAPKVPIFLSPIGVDASSILHTHVATGPLVASFHLSEAEVYAAIALNHAESHVSAGENSGRRLEHVAVVESLLKIGALQKNSVFEKDIEIKLPPSQNPSDLRLIVFLQEAHQGRVVGVTCSPIGSK